MAKEPKSNPKADAAQPAKNSNAEEKPENRENSEASAPAPRRRGRLIAIAVVTLLAAGGGGAAWFLTDHSATASEEKRADGKEVKKDTSKRVPPTFLPMEIFTVNLADRDHFLQIGLTYEVEGSGPVELLKQNMPALRSRILMLLSSKTADDLSPTEGKSILSQELIALAQEIAAPGAHASPAAPRASAAPAAGDAHGAPRKPVKSETALAAAGPIANVHYSAFVIQ